MINDGEVFYIKMTGLKKGPTYFGPYQKAEWDPENTLKEFQNGLERGFQVELVFHLSR